MIYYLYIVLGGLTMKNNYRIKNDCAYIELKTRKEKLECIVDLESLNKLLDLDVLWYIHKNNQTIYVRYQYNGKHEYLHRVLTKAPNNMIVDHINHNGLDNRLSNLRVTDKSTNNFNLSGVRKNNKSGVRGVSWSKQANKWIAQVTKNKKTHHVGYFENVEDAKKAIENFRDLLLKQEKS